MSFSKTAAQEAAVTPLQPLLLWILPVLKTWLMAGFIAATSAHIHGVNAYQKKAAHHIPTAHVITEAEVSLQSPRGGREVLL